MAAPYVFWDAANKRMFSCLYCRRSDWSRSTDVVIEFHVFFSPLFHQFLPPVDDKRIGTNTPSRFIDDETRSIASSSFLLRGSIYPVESDSLQFPKCNQRNGAWNSIAVTCYFQRFSEPFESEECTNCYHLKLAPDTSLENCIWQRNEGVIPATQIFFIPNFLIYLLLPPFFPTDPSFFSLPPPSLTRPYSYSISFFALPPSIPFFHPFPFSYVVPNPPS